MEQRITEQTNGSKKTIGLVFLAMWASAVLFFLVLDLILPEGEKTEAPEIVFRNVGPCLGFDQQVVERFEVGDPQYICGDMETEESKVYLELHIFTIDKKKQIYVVGDTYRSGPILFYVEPLPPGKYWAKISWARPALVDFEFEVVEKLGQ